MFKNLTAGLVISAAFAASAFAGPEDELTMHMEYVTIPQDVFSKIAQIQKDPFDCIPGIQDCPDNDGDGNSGIGTDDADPNVAIDNIINLGQKIWDIVKANQPVVNVKYDYANALPRGVKSSEELDGFSELQSEGIHFWATNTYGVKVYDVTMTAVHQYGGAYQGKGKYLETVSIVPTTVNVSWGYTLDISVSRVSAVNVGTKEAPVGSLTMDTTFAVSTVLQKHQKRILYQFRGDSAKIHTVGF